MFSDLNGTIQQYLQSTLRLLLPAIDCLQKHGLNIFYPEISCNERLSSACMKVIFLLDAQRAAVCNRSGRLFQMNKRKLCKDQPIYVYFLPG